MQNKTIDKTRIAIIGGGPSGIMAAYAASLSGAADIDLYERNEKLGKKLYITGKGRCNVTNACDPQDFFDNVTRNKKFLYSSFYTFDNFALMSFIEDNGTKLKTERGGRVFPVSDKSSDILKSLNNAINKKNIHIILNSKIDSVALRGGRFYLNDEKMSYDKLIIAGGGKSYPVTGSDGSGYVLSKSLGHSVTALGPGLCGIDTADEDTRKLSGLSLKNVRLEVAHKGRKIFSELGEMEFTHYGVSGPLILSASSMTVESNIKEYDFSIDLKTGLNEEKLDARILRDIEAEPNKEIKNALSNLLPFRLMETIIFRCGIDGTKKANQITKEERQRLASGLKEFEIHPIGLRPVEEAIITRGGISCKEINPSTMESKLVNGLYFAGEIIDVDAMTGGFNLQIAFSTGYLAGLSAAARD